MLSSTLPSTVASQTTLTPPVTPSNVLKYIVPATGATGAWTAYPNQITWYENGGWQFITAPVGLNLFVQDSQTLLIWSGTVWDPPTIATPATVAPLMDAVSAIGTSVAYARQDHVHPSDTSKATLASSPTFTGNITAPSFIGSGTGLSPGTVTDSYTIQNIGVVSSPQSLTASNGRYIKMVLGASTNILLNDGTSTTSTEKVLFEITQDATGSRTINWQAHKGFPSGVPPLLSTTAGATDLLEFTWNGLYWITTDLISGINFSSSIVYGLRPSTYSTSTGYGSMALTVTNPQFAYDSGNSSNIDTSTYAYYYQASPNGYVGSATIIYSGFSGLSKSGTLFMRANILNYDQVELLTIYYSTDGGASWTPMESLAHGSTYFGNLSVPLTNQDPTKLQVKVGFSQYNSGYQAISIYDIVFI